MVPKDHDDHRFALPAEIIEEGFQILVGIIDRPKVIVQDISFRIGVIPAQHIIIAVLPPECVVAVWAVALIGEVIGENRLAQGLVRLP